jgi:hypothetical protein
LTTTTVADTRVDMANAGVNARSVIFATLLLLTGRCDLSTSDGHDGGNSKRELHVCYGRVFSLEEELENQREELSTGLLTLYLYSLTGFFLDFFKIKSRYALRSVIIW